MIRYETRLEDGMLYLDPGENSIPVGDFETIIDELGEEYEVEYDEQQSAVPWLDTTDGVLTIEVRETILELRFDEEFADLVADAPLDETGMDDAVPKRTAVFVDLLRKIWDSKGNLDSL